jgi:hypothetical protein
MFKSTFEGSVNVVDLQGEPNRPAHAAADLKLVHALSLPLVKDLECGLAGSKQLSFTVLGPQSSRVKPKAIFIKFNGPFPILNGDGYTHLQN